MEEAAKEEATKYLTQKAIFLGGFAVGAIYAGYEGIKYWMRTTEQEAREARERVAETREFADELAQEVDELQGVVEANGVVIEDAEASLRALELQLQREDEEAAQKAAEKLVRSKAKNQMPVPTSTSTKDLLLAFSDEAPIGHQEVRVEQTILQSDGLTVINRHLCADKIDISVENVVNDGIVQVQELQVAQEGALKVNTGLVVGNKMSVQGDLQMKSSALKIGLG